MLLKRRSITATIGWLLVRLQADEAFPTFGRAPLAKVKGLPSITSCCTRGAPHVATILLSPRAVDTTWGRSCRDVFALRMSTGGNAVELPVGTSSQEERSVLDTLIEQFTSPNNGNVTATVEEYLDLCDHALLTHLRRRIESAGMESTLVRMCCGWCFVILKTQYS